MKKPLLLAALLLAGTASVHAFTTTDAFERARERVLAATSDDRAGGSETGAFRLADRNEHRERRDLRREHHEDDGDDDDDRDESGGHGAGRMPAAGPTDPSTPVPDNGLFQGKARPKVEVN